MRFVLITMKPADKAKGSQSKTLALFRQVSTLASLHKIDVICFNSKQITFRKKFCKSVEEYITFQSNSIVKYRTPSKVDKDYARNTKFLLYIVTHTYEFEFHKLPFLILIFKLL